MQEVKQMWVRFEETPTAPPMNAEGLADVNTKQMGHGGTRTPVDRSESDGTDFMIKGYASVFDHIDQHNDRVVRGAFTAALQKRTAAGHKPKFLWQHQEDQVIGVWHKLQEDAYGLYVEGSLINHVQKAREAHALLQAKAVDGLSIGYRIVKSMRGRAPGAVRLLTEIDLLEISLVTFPSNERSRIL